MKRGLISAVAALSLLSGSAAMAAGSSASSLSVSGAAQASAPASKESSALGGDTTWIGVAVFVAIVAIVFLVADSDDGEPVSA